MKKSPVQVSLFGATGSIGISTLEVIATSDGAFELAALTAHSALDKAVEQARRFRPRWLVATDKALAADYDWSDLPPETELLFGEEGIHRIATAPEVDIVVAAVVGFAGLHGALAAVGAGKRLALANKETLVAAGAIVMEAARTSGAEILPVDSEHSAIFQALASGRMEEVQRIILTASGGPFLSTPLEQLKDVTVDGALAHPTWNMGAKITIDSATMMNKALELIEARWLFSVEAERLGVMIHPQSIVHSMVEYRDGSIIAQMSPPDMKLPIQYALTWPERLSGPAERLDWTSVLDLRFEPPDPERFPAIGLGLQVADSGGTAGAVLNAANESAVESFLDNKMKFSDIVPAVRSVLDNHEFDPAPSLEQLFSVDAWARKEVLQWS